MSELYKKYRPSKLSQVVGQGTVVKILDGALEAGNFPHAILLSGPSGVGKTTIARIVAQRLGASDVDIREVNCANNNGVDTIRAIQGRLHLRSMSGGPSVYLLDECHSLTTQAQQSMLKMLEDAPESVYFILCTTDPQKVIPTVKNRCQHHQLKAVPTATLLMLLKAVVKAEGQTVSEDALQKLASGADGSARKALVLLDSMLLSGEAGIKDILEVSEVRAEMVDLVRAIYGRSNWRAVSKLANEITNEEVESLRHFILSWGMGMLTRDSEAAKAAEIMGHFTHDFFQSKKPGIILAIYRATQG